MTLVEVCKRATAQEPDSKNIVLFSIVQQKERK
jgi:hypothetical protein